MSLNKNNIPCVRRNMPEWFSDPSFLAVLNDSHSRVMTWHKKGFPPSEFSDVMLYITDGEPDTVMPFSIQEDIAAIDEHVPHDSYWLWVTNFEEE